MRELSGIGEVTARCITESLHGEEPVYLRRLEATAGAPVAEGGGCAPGRPARRLPHPFGLVGRRLADPGDGR